MQVLRKFDMRKNVYMLFILLVILIVFISSLEFYKTLSYDLQGTYGVGSEPNDKQVYMVLKNEEFVVYDQGEILDSGSIKEVNSRNTLDIYALVSEDDTRVGYVVHEKNHIVLLNFRGMDYSLEKISRNAMYLGYESE